MNDPLLTVLNFSGGKQSSCLLWMVLRGDLPVPPNFAVLNADPGMENSGTYDYVEMMREECQRAGIYFETVPGPNLYDDIINLPHSEKTRLDSPPYWTRDKETGKKGRLVQKCTKVYKIAPMDRAVRRLLHEIHGISLVTRRPGENVVEKWIGFARDEAHRIKPSQQKYIYFEYPLIDAHMKTADVISYFHENGLPLPPRSVCNACFANGGEAFREMYEQRPQDWEQAVAVDEASRDWSQIGVRDEVYVSQTLKPLRVLPSQNFGLEEENADDWSCDSGYCFT